MPATWVTYSLIAANIVAFVIEVAAGADPIQPDAQKVLELGGNFAPLTLDGQWWRLGTSMFLHFGVLHIAMNMLVLYQGRIVEVLYGRIRFAALYVAAGLLGGVASLVRGHLAVSAGASGAVFGVFGAFGAFLLVRRDRIDPNAAKASARSLAMFVALNLAIGFGIKGIDLSAHVGGLLGGFLGGVAVLAGARADRHAIVRALAVLAVAVGISAATVAWRPVPDALVRFAGETQELSDLLDEFGKLEQQSVDKYNYAVGELQKQGGANGQADQTRLADVLDRDILPPWRALEQRATALADVPPRFQHLVELLRAYLKARDDEWSARADMLRGKVAPDTDQLRALSDATKRSGEAFAAELKQVGGS